MVTLSCAASTSSTGETVTARASFQLALVKVRGPPETVTAPVSGEDGVTVTVLPPPGSEFSDTA